jgi:hypothetical protein
LPLSLGDGHRTQEMAAARSLELEPAGRGEERGEGLREGGWSSNRRYAGWDEGRDEGSLELEPAGPRAGGARTSAVCWNPNVIWNGEWRIGGGVNFFCLLEYMCAYRNYNKQRCRIINN